MSCRNPCRLYIHLAFTCLLHWSLERSVKQRTWRTSSAFSTKESAWNVFVAGSQSHVCSGPHLTWVVIKTWPYLQASNPIYDLQSVRIWAYWNKLGGDGTRLGSWVWRNSFFEPILTILTQICPLLKDVKCPALSAASVIFMFSIAIIFITHWLSNLAFNTLSLKHDWDLCIHNDIILTIHFCFIYLYLSIFTWVVYLLRVGC
jgi:hypothetical protein